MGHDKLSGGGDVVFLRHGDTVHLPETPDLGLGLLEHIQVDVVHLYARVHSIENDPRGIVTPPVEQSFEIGCSQRMIRVAVVKIGRCCNALRKRTMRGDKKVVDDLNLGSLEISIHLHLHGV